MLLSKVNYKRINNNQQYKEELLKRECYLVKWHFLSRVLIEFTLKVWNTLAHWSRVFFKNPHCCYRNSFIYLKTLVREKNELQCLTIELTAAALERRWVHCWYLQSNDFCWVIKRLQSSLLIEFKLYFSFQKHMNQMKTWHHTWHHNWF